jgi:hypothetical protein
LARGEKIELLVVMWWKNVKMWLLIIFIVIVM